MRSTGMNFDFTDLVDRRNTGSLKWDLHQEIAHPLWVADMDYDTAPPIKRALIERIERGALGYAVVRDEWYEAYQKWWKRRYSLDLKKESLVFSLGVLPSISSLVRKLTTPNEGVVLMTPCYNNFYNSVRNNGRRVIESPLSYIDGRYSIDFELLERDLSDPQTTMLILCNPQNPTGNIWSQEDLGRIAALSKKHGVIVLSDEVHADITRPGMKYNPFLLGEDAKEVGIMLMAPTKSFNIAGLHTSALYTENSRLLSRAVRALNTDEIAEPNVLSIPAVLSAYENGEAWLEEMRGEVFENREFVSHYLEENLPSIHVVEADATYLLWVDVSRITEDSERLSNYLMERNSVMVSPGEEYGARGFLRINLATPKESLERGIEALIDGIKSFRE